MPRSLILLDTEVDRLWRRHLSASSGTGGDFAADETVIIDLKSPPSSRFGPHHQDPVNWRRWLKKHHIEQLHCYQPGRKALLLLAAAQGQTEINLHLTGPVTPEALRSLKLLGRGVKRFFCAGNFIAKQLLKARLDSEKITVRIPSVSVIKPPAAARRQLRRRIKKDKAGPLILALSPPHNAAALKSVIWAAALIGYALPNLTLVVTGPCEPADQRRLLHWQQMLDAADILYLDQGTIEWDDLVGACEVVAAGPGPLNEVIRLLHVRTQQQHIVASNGDSNEFLDGYDKVHYASSSAPRRLAQAILNVLENRNAG